MGPVRWHVGETLPCILLCQVWCTEGCKRTKAVDMPPIVKTLAPVNTPAPSPMHPPHWITCPAINTPAHCRYAMAYCQYACCQYAHCRYAHHRCAHCRYAHRQYAHCRYAHPLSICMAPVNMPAPPSICPSYCWYIPRCRYSCPTVNTPIPLSLLWSMVLEMMWQGAWMPTSLAEGRGKQGTWVVTCWHSGLMLAGWMMQWELQLRWRWWSQIAWLDPKWVFTMGSTEWRWGLEVEGGGGNEKRWCGRPQFPTGLSHRWLESL